MGDCHHKVKNVDLLASALELCATQNWSQNKIDELTHDSSSDPLKVAHRVLTDAFHQSNLEDTEKLKNVDTLLQCIYRGDYIFAHTYRPAELFNALFKDPNLNWKNDLTQIERHALASFFSFGISKNPADFDFSWGFRTDEDHTYTSLISFIKANYFPSRSSRTPKPIPRKEICSKILESKFNRNLSPQNSNIFSDSFCPKLVEERLNVKRNETIGQLYGANNEDKVLEILQQMVPNQFRSGAEIIPYIIKNPRHFQAGLFFQKIQSEDVLQQVLSFLSPIAQEKTLYAIWSRSRNSLPLNIKIEELKEISISTLINELTDYVADADGWDSKDPEFRMKTNKDYFKKIYYSLPKKERPTFVEQVAKEYHARMSKNPDKKIKIKEEGITLLDSLNRWWAFDPSYIDNAIKKLKA